MIPAQLHTSARQALSNQALDLIGSDSLKATCIAPGPFVTVFLPACHPGAPDLPRTERMKTILRNAAQELERRRFHGPIGQILKPLEKLADNPANLIGGSDSVIFASPGNFRHLRLLSPTRERLIVASHPHITPLLADLVPEHEFYVLAITKKLLRLGRWYGGQCTEVPVPAGVPKSFEEVLVFDRPDHDLQNRSPAAASASQVGPARFGTGSERDLVHERLRRYLQLVDRNLTGSLKGAPLVLVGVAEELAAYRSVSEYPRVLAAKPSSPEHLTWAELGERAKGAVMAARREEAERVLAEFRETARRDRVISGIREVLAAAHEGRVHRLLVEKDAEHQALLGPSFPIDSARVEGEQDLINTAAVENIAVRQQWGWKHRVPIDRARKLRHAHLRCAVHLSVIRAQCFIQFIRQGLSLTKLKNRGQIPGEPPQENPFAQMEP
jgi:Bacterial archaeo-eukaryotic release factor family 3